MSDCIVEIISIYKKNNKYLVKININNEKYYFFEDDIVKYKILKGSIFTYDEWKNIVYFCKDSVYYNKVLFYIDYKPRTKKEVINYLNYDLNLINNQELVTSIIKELESINIINDDRYCKDMISEYIKNNKGRMFITSQLVQKGISNECISNYLNNYSNEIFYNNALMIATNSLKQVEGLPIIKQKESIYSKLYRNGYEVAIINDVLSKLTFSELSYDLLEKEITKLRNKGIDNNKIINKLLSKGYDYDDILSLLSNNNDSE